MNKKCSSCGSELIENKELTGLEARVGFGPDKEAIPPKKLYRCLNPKCEKYNYPINEKG